MGEQQTESDVRLSHVGQGRHPARASAGWSAEQGAAGSKSTRIMCERTSIPSVLEETREPNLLRRPGLRLKGPDDDDYCQDRER